MKLLKNCCCCCQVDVGGYIIAGFGLFCAFCILMGAFAPRADCDARSKLYMQEHGNQNTTDDYAEMMKTYCKVSNISGPYSAVLQALIYFAVFGFLILGIVKRNHYMVLPSVIFFGIDVVVLAGVILILLFFAISADAFGVMFVIMALFVVIPLSALFIYLFFVVLSIFKKIQDEKNNTNGVVYQQQMIMVPGQGQPNVYQPTSYSIQQPQSAYPLLPQKHEKNYP